VNREQNPEHITLDGKAVKLQDYVQEHERLSEENNRLKSVKKKAVKRYEREEELKPFQAELLQVQRHLEENRRRMIILFEGRDAAGKGGTIRRVTRYMNEKHYRVVALGKPTDEQKTQWYYQKFVSQFPRAGEAVLFDRSWYNRAMVERVFSYCTEKEYYDFMRGVVGFERDLVRQDTILVNMKCSSVPILSMHPGRLCDRTTSTWHG
jgi:polyphosphate kinase 2 (PPK2 family)